MSRQAGYQAVKRCGIPVTDGKVDREYANMLYERHTRKRVHLQATGEAQASIPTPASAPAPGAIVLPPSTTDEGEYSVNRARRERYEADLAQMKLQEQQGDLVRVVEVRAEIAKRVGQVRMNLLQIPARLSPLLANEADQAKVHALLDAEIRSVLANVTQGD